MGQQSTTHPKARPAGQLVWLALVVALALAIGSAALAQETPEPTAQETPQEPARISIQAPPEPITVGEEFALSVFVEDVAHLAAFDFAISFDPARLQPVAEAGRADDDDTPPERSAVRGDAGEFLATGERGDTMTCDGPFSRADDSQVFVSCVTLGPPLCLDGLPGASGSGLLGRVFFKAEAAGATTVELTDPTSLVLDDVQPCDASEDPGTIEIMHSRENATVEVQEMPSRIWIDAPTEPITVGEEFQVSVLVEDVAHLAAFDFAIAFDPARLQPVNSADDADADDPPPERLEVGGDAGELLATGERGENMTCDGPYFTQDAGNIVFVSCVTLGPPLCLEGLPGADGSGVLGRVVFKAEAAGVTTLELIDPTSLLLDDVEPCDPAQDPRTVEILHRRENATVELVGDSGFPWLIVGPIVGVVLVVLVGGAAWFRRSRQRDVAPPSGQGGVAPPP